MKLIAGILSHPVDVTHHLMHYKKEGKVLIIRKILTERICIMTTTI